MDIKEILKKHLQPSFDGISEKDWKFASLIPDLKKVDKKENILRLRTSISDQGQLPSCTSNATCDAFEQVNGDGVELSRLFVFWNSRPVKILTGTSIRSALDSIRKFGVPPEESWPYDPTNVNVKPPEETWKIAEKRKRTTYYRVTSRQDIIASIDAGWPIVFTIPLDEDFVTKNPEPDHVFMGRSLTNSFHTMMIVGYRIIDNECHFRIRNSWGKAWGDNGHCWFDSGYVMRSLQDAWAVTNYTPDEPLVSRRNAEFALETLMSVSSSSLSIYAAATSQIDTTTLVVGLLSSVALQAFGVWRRWWINLTINDKLPLFPLF